MRKWKTTGLASCATKLEDDLYLSFNSDPSVNPPTDAFITSSVNLGRPETALVSDDRYLILYGDWREAFERAYDAGGRHACIALFTKN